MPVRIEMLPVYIAIGISAILAVSASFMRLLTVPAAIAAAVMLTAAAVFWGFTGMTLYLALFALSSLIGAVGGKRRKEEGKNFFPSKKISPEKKQKGRKKRQKIQSKPDLLWWKPECIR